MQRPTTMEGYLDVSSRFTTPEGLAQGLAFQPKPDDVFVSPYAKCGTTWMQQIVHGLRTHGSMAFSEITEVVPWIELAHDMGIDLNAPQVAQPRAFKSHLRWDEIPKGGKYIVVLRDPLDAFVSLHRFMSGWFFEPGSISLDVFADHYLTRPDGESYWGHLMSWWEQRDNPDVMLFSFEAMKQDLPPIVEKVSQFIGLDATSRQLDIATRQAGFSFMKENDDKFDDHILRELRNPACGLPFEASISKVNRGHVGNKSDMISDDVHARFTEKWQATIGERFGISDYTAVLLELN